MATYSSALTIVGDRVQQTLSNATLNILATLDPSSDVNSYMDVHFSQFYGSGTVSATLVIQSWDPINSVWKQVTTFGLENRTVSSSAGTPAPITFGSQNDIDLYKESGRALETFRLQETFAAYNPGVAGSLVPPIRLYAGERLVTTPSITGTVGIALNTIKTVPGV